MIIKTKNDLKIFLEADRLSLGRKKKFFKDDIWRFQILLRNVEYHLNSNKSFLSKLYLKIIMIRFEKYSLKLGFTIPPNVAGPGLSIAHIGTIVINQNVRIGLNCRMHTCVNIGNQPASGGISPVLGDNVYISPGAKIFGAIKIANGIAIGANAVVNKSFSEENISIGGIPAKKISMKGAIQLRKKYIDKVSLLLK